MFAVYDVKPFYEHPAPAGHPERPERLRAVEAVYSSLPENTLILEAPRCEEADILLVHTKEHLEAVRRACEEERSFDFETFAFKGSWEAALRAVGGVRDAVARVLKGELKAAFVPTRPPGHHAEPDRAMGFCLFNNVAIGAKAALGLGAGSVTIVDWDTHHGNGTQRVFYEEPRVFYFSIHQFPLYPGSGRPEETGRGDGRGFTLNVPVPPGLPPKDSVKAFGNAMGRLSSFPTDIVVVSAGFDAHNLDPLSHQRLEGEHYKRMTEMVTTLAERVGAKGIVSALEGGYSLEGLEDGLSSHLKVLMDYAK